MSVRAEIPVVPGLDVHALPFQATEGTPVYNVTVATFTDAGAKAIDLAYYSATVTWGDGTGPYEATLSPDLAGIDVNATHVYTQHGKYLVEVTVTHRDGRTDSDSREVLVSDAPLTAQGTVVSAIEATEFSGCMATFKDGNPYGTLKDFSATIFWGDKETSIGNIEPNAAGGFSVFGSHTYAHQNSVATHVLIRDVGGSKVWAAGTANVTDAPLIAAGSNLSVTEGSPFSGIVATFTHADVTATRGDFAAVIRWGDDPNALPLGGDVIDYGPPGSFAVWGSHTYLYKGSYALSIEITASGGSTASAGGTANAGNAAFAASGVAVSGTEGFSMDAVVATFTDANPNTGPNDYSALIDWGDGTHPSAGYASINAGGGFKVTGTHLYVHKGSYAINVVIYDQGDNGASAGTTATITDAPLTVKAMPIAKVEGEAFNGVVAIVADTNPLSDPNELKASIDWGDGSTSDGVINPLEQKGSYNVVGSHTYTNWGSYGLIVTISEVGGNVSSAGETALIADAPLTAVGRVITPTESASFFAVVANFTDSNPYGTKDQFTASLDWGDGNSTAGTITPNDAVNTGLAEFVVMGSHSYANQGLYPVVVSIQSKGGSHTAAGSAAVTADAPMVGYGKTINVVKGVAFTNVIADCVDTDTTPEPETTYNSIIDWGDGTTSNGTIIESEESSYSVRGSHTYEKAGSYLVLATIDNMQTFVSTTARSTAVVSESPATNMTAQFVIKSGKPVYNKNTGLYRQSVTIKNPSKQQIGGPISLVLDNLSNGGGSITLDNKDGVTLSAGVAPLGSPYKNVALPRSNVFPARNTRSLTLYFRSSSKTITYTPRVLAGPGAR